MSIFDPASTDAPPAGVTDQATAAPRPDAITLDPGHDAVSRRLADHTTFRIGGEADHLVVAHDPTELIDAVTSADDRGEPVLIISGGSNMLVSDEGFPGTVVVVATRGLTTQVDHDGGVRLQVAAGQGWDDLVAHTVDHCFSGLETLSGIPGLVGAAPMQNIGAYGAEVRQSVTRVHTFDRRRRELVSFEASDCAFGYRTSRFKQEPDRHVILSVEFLLHSSPNSQPVKYAELARHLGVDPGESAPIDRVRQAVITIRRSKGMVLDAADHDTWSAGSFFTNPILTADQAAHLPPEAPRYDQGAGQVKTSAAWLIDHAGIHKGFGDGPAQVSSAHVLALTNRGAATASDVLDLARLIRDRVLDTYQVRLEPEPVLVGLSL
ncbi:MAG: UDP-N-acetylmuramate dehydrogenase [Propionibacteriaceae bacterium]|jgi:UDP-N-acetylmuramate dehydrogenase|nr:UDP-N-acetylmuramate dehydrogenase [Propionibacteriaceae bacterium]